ncbi:DUF4834 family protein [Aureibacter tunicatorum]|uniref:DUF4834 family protein n=1 Tax=Aureibacter tunicatorum TaxID=866807 RepID=A0AAE3XLJ7_9BACT|nr:DUF4834 family protein [Aureibacter tunicatorum]MDR6237169.1 hypothetical protein [Aureibacter tunicatorum]BDD06161.1 hypothetical protein AUTU_36440 [Aureibacter tunicatorum]
MLFKIVVFFLILFFVFKKFGHYILKMILKAFMKQQTKKYAYQNNRGSYQYNHSQSQRKSARNSNVHIDYVPEQKKNRHEPGHFTGGDYVDFEEVK